MDLTDVCFAGITRQAELLRSGAVSSRALVDEYLARIDRLDPDFNAYRLVFREAARAEADAADERRARGADAPLLGVPIAVKEDQALAGLPTTNGTNAVTAVADADAETVRRLRAAGAVIIGRTRAPELCLFPYAESESGGNTRNPWSAGHSPAGSSGGSAAVVAAGLAAAALGTDGGGSIRLPAAATGIYGLKPQRGRVSLRPESRVWGGFSVAGPLTTTVADAALMLDVLHGSMPGDADRAEPPATTFVQAARSDPGRLRIALSLRPWPVGMPVDRRVREAVERTARCLAGLGHRVVTRPLRLPDPTAMRTFGPRYVRFAAEAAAALDEPERLERRARQVAAIGRWYPDRVIRSAERLGLTIAAAANAVFDDFDLVLTPTMPRLAPRIGEMAGRNVVRGLAMSSLYASFTALWNLAGNPAASVPAGFAPDGLPLAAQLIGRQHDECTVLAVSAQLEREQPWSGRRPPGCG